MNATRFGLLKRDVAEAFQVTDLNDLDTFALLVGRVTLLLFGAFLLWGIVSASYQFTVKQFKGWLTKEAPQDIPDFVVCTCVRATQYGTDRILQRSPKCAVHGVNANRTNTLSIDDFRKENEWNKA